MTDFVLRRINKALDRFDQWKHLDSLFFWITVGAIIIIACIALGIIK
jgi:hypothetical protein